MAVKQELAEEIRRAGRVESLDLLPPNPSFFHHRAVGVITDITEMEIDFSSIAFQAACKETVAHLLPLVDFLTQPRGIQEFQDLKRELMKVIWQYDSRLKSARGERFENEEEARIGGVVGWLEFLLPELRLFPDLEVENIFMPGWAPEGIWAGWENVEERPFRRVEEKIVSFEKAVELAEAHHQTRESRVGYTIGKWRLGPHSEHIRLFQEAKEALGWNGLLIVGVESQRSIWQRRGRDHFALPDKERLGRIASLEAVDYVVLLNPSDEELEDLQSFYYQADQKLYRNLWFVGSRDYHWRPEFEKRCRELGMILLWRSPTTRLSSTELIEQIRKAS